MPHFLLLFPLSKFPISTVVQISFLFSSLIVIVLLYKFVYRNLYVINYKPLILHNSTCVYTFLVWPLDIRQPINFSLSWERPTLPLLILLYCLKFFVSAWSFKRFPPSCWLCYWWYSCSVYVWAVLVRLHGCDFLHYQETQSHSKVPDPLLLTNVLFPSISVSIWALFTPGCEQRHFFCCTSNLSVFDKQLHVRPDRIQTVAERAN